MEVAITYRNVVFADVNVEFLECSQVVELIGVGRGHLLQHLPQLLVTDRLGSRHISVVTLHLKKITRLLRNKKYVNNKIVEITTGFTILLVV